MIPFKVILWEFNSQKVIYYDVMPYFVKEWNNLSIQKRANVDLKDFILTKALKFWSKCEYEIEVGGVPHFDKQQKIDAYEQIEANIASIISVFKSNIE